MEGFVIFSKGYAFCCEENGGLMNILSSTESTFGWDDTDFYKSNAKSYWIKMGSRPGSGSNLSTWAEYVLPNIKQDFILVTTDGDVSVPDEISDDVLGAIISNRYLRRWYTQNFNELADFVDDRIIGIPIGLDAHTPSDLGTWLDYGNALKDLNENHHALMKSKKIFIDFGTNISHPFRTEIIRQLKWKSQYKILRKRIKKKKLINEYLQNGSVLSVRGNGHDCHRTWEALAVGVPVIVYTPEINNLLRQYGIYSVTDRSELYSKNLLNDAMQHYSANPPSVPDFKDVFLSEDLKFFQWDNYYEI